MEHTLAKVGKQAIPNILRLPPAFRLANVERERLWNGLERFVNCGSDYEHFLNFGHAFPGFWPVPITYRPDSTGVFPRQLKWHPACHRLFLCYRDALRDVWKNEGRSDAAATFLLGVSDLNRVACNPRKRDSVRFVFDLPLRKLRLAWKQLRREVPTASPSGHAKFGLVWDRGEFRLDFEDVGNSDFLTSFYLLFRQSWRGRVCPLCNIFFVARATKQTFCGISCSAKSRKVSKLKWWRREGAKRRARQIKRAVSGGKRR